MRENSNSANPVVSITISYILCALVNSVQNFEQFQKVLDQCVFEMSVSGSVAWSASFHRNVKSLFRFQWPLPDGLKQLRLLVK